MGESVEIRNSGTSSLSLPKNNIKGRACQCTRNFKKNILYLRQLVVRRCSAKHVLKNFGKYAEKRLC